MNNNFIWCTDIHLDFIELEYLENINMNSISKDIYPKKINKFLTDLNNSDKKILIITGDISTGNLLLKHLNLLQNYFRGNIYFILGNHDYYGSYISPKRIEISSFCKENKNKNILLNRLIYLETEENFHILDDNTAIIGSDGWYDGLYGDYLNSDVVLNDFVLIKDFKELFNIFSDSIINIKRIIFNKMSELAFNCSRNINRKLMKCQKNGIKNIIIATHVPPFKEVSYHKDKMSGDDFLPFYSSKSMGDIINDFCLIYKDINVLVLCGHTHTKRDVQILPNLRVIAGESQYGNPEIQKIENKYE